MLEGPVISNASPLIALTQIGLFSLLRDLFGTLVIPPAVRKEISRTVHVPAWILERRSAGPLHQLVLEARLGTGESEAISLGLEARASVVLLDDLRARRLAGALGLPLMGTVGVLLLAKNAGQLPALRPHLDALLTVRFHIAPRLYADALVRAGET